MLAELSRDGLLVVGAMSGALSAFFLIGFYSLLKSFMHPAELKLVVDACTVKWRKED